MVQGCARFLKYLFIFFNLIFLLSGLLGFGFGIWGKIEGDAVLEQDWFPKIPDKGLLSHIGVVFSCLIVASLILVVIAFVGFCGGLKENKCLLVVFFILVFIVTFIIIAGLVLLGSFEETLVIAMKKLFAVEKEKYRKGTSEYKEGIDKMQEEYTCCLWTEKDAKSFNITSCFAEKTSTTAATPAFHDKDCAKVVVAKVKQFMKEKQDWFSGITAIILIVCVLSMILSLYICCKLKSEDYNNLT